jgi:hypothetical protein
MRWLPLFLLGCASAAPTAAPVRAKAKAHIVEVAVAAIVPPPAASTAAVEAKPAPRSPFAYANIDPDDDWTVGPPDIRATCDAELAAAGISSKTASLPVHPVKKIQCGAPQVVIYKGSPAKISYSPSVMTTCTMALALARFETIIQDEAKKIFGKRVVKIEHVGTYACREMANYKGWVSEHSYANAIDLTEFVLEDGRTISVLKHFKPQDTVASTKEGQFLRAIASRAFKEETFSTVLTPYFDKLHANHFHLDQARFRSDGTTPLN